ncbi:MAG: hypothetical protein J6Y85_05470 [Alphaproteobacteria bacterium]|nr:hypothetical protein [Alphaproteobacteria bacterium]
MKKNIILFVLGLTLTQPAMAETTIPWTKEGCESVKGTWITAHQATDTDCSSTQCNGMNFCASTVGINFFNALIWCKSIGHKLTDFTHLCPGATGQINTPGICVNAKGLISGDSWGWTTSPGSAQGKSILVRFLDARYQQFDRNFSPSNNMYAICEE